jgi:hypothetical protein
MLRGDVNGACEVRSDGPEYPGQMLSQFSAPTRLSGTHTADSSTAAIRRGGEDGAAPTASGSPAAAPLYGAWKGEGPIAANV